MKKNNNYFILLLILLICISIGYAVLNSTLTINGKSNISKNTWDLYFDNIKIKDGSVEAVEMPVIENATAVKFKINLNKPGDYFEFTFDVVNNGSIDAMIDTINKTPDLTLEQQKYLNYIIEYENGEQILRKQLVKKEEKVRLKVKVEYKKDLSSSDLPAVVDNINLGFYINYIQRDIDALEVLDNGMWQIYADDLLEEIGTIVTIGSEKFYSLGLDGDNVKLLSMYNLNVGYMIPFSQSEISPELNDNSTGMQLTSASCLQESIFPVFGSTSFSDDSKKGVNYSSYNGSIVESYVNNYKLLLENKFDVNILEARLITRTELKDSNTFACSDYLACSKKYPWLYSTSYWVETADSNNFNWIISCNNRFLLSNSTYNTGFGVRPIIVMSKNEINDFRINKVFINFSIDGKMYQAEEGMTWNDWVNSKYNVDNFRTYSEANVISNDNKIVDGILKKDTIIANGEYFFVLTN